jgi:hypothetical protein
MRVPIRDSLRCRRLRRFLHIGFARFEYRIHDGNGITRGNAVPFEPLGFVNDPLGVGLVNRLDGQREGRFDLDELGIELRGVVAIDGNLFPPGEFFPQRINPLVSRKNAFSQRLRSQIGKVIH